MSLQAMNLFYNCQTFLHTWNLSQKASDAYVSIYSTSPLPRSSPRYLISAWWVNTVANNASNYKSYDFLINLEVSKAFLGCIRHVIVPFVREL